ncbi:probable multidrug resistance-associated protein lethal(2)03659 [Drosophila sulfurigaster albostrigata]|uniref:probable multidrug resistance-associated protein lethal(2)03659 n=1 Tax=Drosophila sulfurigaster albostrigata TaxID=89887 RepID=UPI002D21EE0A|nr:probable multidrug resistance-associated protein lethal(2)03659 [Drosophila sulfurigaster albostrigata]
MNSHSNTSVKRETNPFLKANILSKWFFVWMRHVFRKGRHEELSENELYAHLPSFDSEQLTEDVQQPWIRESQRKQPSLLHLIFSFYGWQFVPICVLYSALEIAIHAFQPIFLGGLISYFAEGQTDITKESAYLYAMGIVLCSLVNSLVFHPFMFYVFAVGTRIRLACAGLIYRKCLRAGMNAGEGLGAQAISVMSIDLPQFDLTFYFFHDLWKGPVEACIFGYIMYTEIGWTALIGIAFIVLLIPLQAWAAKAATQFRTRSAEHRDERVKLMNEIITAIQVIKMYAWEQSFAKLIAAVRQREVRAIRGSMSIYAALQCTNMISKVSLFLSLIAYVYTGDVVTAQKVFILSSYYSLLNDSLLHFWPMAITTWAQTVVSARRVVDFLQQSETPTGKECSSCHDNPTLQLDSLKPEKPQQVGRVHCLESVAKGLMLSHVSASWDKPSTQQQRRAHVDDISFELHATQMVGIVGNVGSGKSTLLNVILGEVELMQGRLELHGKVSYAPQEPWIFQASIRDNILFVEPYDEQRYRAVVHACQLDTDLTLLPQGDATVVGERGISLSGGQKARISLARAVYRQADVYLFDDPLAAVDSRVGKLLMDKCFHRFLGDKLRILVTHHVQLLQQVDHLLLLESGRITQQGSYAQLRDVIEKHAAPDLEAIEADKQQVKRVLSQVDRNSKQFQDTATSASEEQTPENAFAEGQGQGAVSYETYKSYFQALGAPFWVCLVLVLFVVARACQALMDIFISRWATLEENRDYDSIEEFEATRTRMVTWYSVLLVCTLALYLLRTFGFFLLCLRISLRLHNLLFAGIIRARMFFFNTNASGRVLNRFSSDIENVDVALPQAMMDSLQFFVDVIAVLVIVAIANYWLLIPAAIMALLMYLCRAFYIGASRSLKRIESLTRSPVYSHANQTFQGLTTIRALDAMPQLEHTFHGHQNINSSALFLYTSANRAFSFWTDLICVIYIFAVTFSFLVIQQNFYSGDVGLAITQSMTLVLMCQWGMRQSAELENKMTSVERILEYAKTPSEPALETPKQIQLPANWPHEGHLRLSELHMRYSPGGTEILKGLNLETRPMEKIGIVGRTGAGKSSIIQALFRLAENEGLIEIDGQDIAQLGLHDLRSRISIIPQESVLFSGTLRFNLDPFSEKSDEALWGALQDVKLKEYVASLEGGLSCHMQEGGSNFSMGQRQLVCLARAILRNNRILIMDEATANVDADTDKLIQETIQTKFAECTVLTIAHRLHTVMDNDSVLVMDAGKMIEFGPPHELLQLKDGALLKLVNQSDALTVKYLKKIAADNYARKNKYII